MDKTAGIATQSARDAKPANAVKGLIGHMIKRLKTHQRMPKSIALHETGTVVSGAQINGRAVARVGDQISCVAVILTGAPGTIIEGQPAARQGNSTSHASTLVEGEPSGLVEK